MSGKIKLTGDVAEIVNDLNVEFFDGNISAIAVVFLDKDGKTVYSSWGGFPSFIAQLGAIEQAKDSMFRQAQDDERDARKSDEAEPV